MENPQEKTGDVVMDNEKRAAEDMSAKSLEAGTGSDLGLDVAAQFYATLDPAIRAAEITPEEERKVRWKIDLMIIPLLALTAILAAVDKNTLSNAAIYGMLEDTHLVGNQYSIVGSLFFVAYALFEPPFAWLIQRLPVAKLLGGVVFLWGVLAMCTAAAHNFAGLASVRFFMGGMEAVMYPTSSVITTMWFTRTEQPIRVAIWFNQFSTIFTGIISYGVGKSNADIAKWKEIFLVLGGITIFWSGVILFFLPDSPVNCRWLDDRQKYVAIERVRRNNTGIEEKNKIKWDQVREALIDPKTWLLFIFGAAQNIVNGGLNTFASIIVSTFGFTRDETVLLGMPTGVIGTAWQVILAICCVYFVNKRCMIVALSNLVPLICAVLLWQLPRDNSTGLLAAYLCFYTYFGSYVTAASLPMANTSGHSKKVTVNAVFFASYAVGNICGPQVFRAKDAPDYINGYTGLMCVVIVAMVAISLYGVVCWNENRIRNNKYGPAEGDHGQADESFSDQTDKEKTWFRYSY